MRNFNFLFNYFLSNYETRNKLDFKIISNFIFTGFYYYYLVLEINPEALYH